MYPVRISGKLVVLREFTSGDLDSLLTIVSDDRVTRWLSFDPRDRAETHVMLAGIIERARLEPRSEYYLAISVPEDDNQVAGFIRFGLTGVKAAKVGYAIRPERQGRGYATDAARAVISFGFARFALHKVIAEIDPDNMPSLAMMGTLGFVREARIRDHVYTGGAWRDSELYSVLEHEWAAADPAGAAR